MNRIDMHPEDLLDAAHAGQLTTGERARLHQHVSHCSACATELTLVNDFDASLSAQAGDDDLIDRLVASTMATSAMATSAMATSAMATSAMKSGPVVTEVPAESTRAAAPRATREAPRRILWAAAASLIIGAFGGAAAAMVAMTQSDEPERVEMPTEPDVAPELEAARRARAQRAPIPAPPETTPEEVVEDVDPDESLVVAPIEDTVMPDRGPRPAPRIGRPSASELLAQANQARRERDYRGAVRVYRQLQRAHPRSREAALSRVTLGRLLLDGMNEPANALSEFDRYLGQRRHRVLDEEARVGRALALQRLGRRDAERAAWRDLLSYHPDTLHAERARARL